MDLKVGARAGDEGAGGGFGRSPTRRAAVPVGPYFRTMPRLYGGAGWGGRFLMSEATPYA